MSTDAVKTVTVKLEYPVTVNGKDYSELTFRRRKAKDLVASDAVKGEERKWMATLSSMADVALPVIEELDSDDWERVVEETLPLMGKSIVTAVKAGVAEVERMAAKEAGAG